MPDYCQLVSGTAAQLLLERLRPGSRQYLRPLKYLNAVALVGLFYLIFAKSFADSQGAISFGLTCRLVAWVSGVHLVVLLASWLVAYAARFSVLP